MRWRGCGDPAHDGGNAADLPSAWARRTGAAAPISADRRALLLTAHLVWGATLGAVMEALEPAQVEAPGMTERASKNEAKELRHAL